MRQLRAPARPRLSSVRPQGLYHPGRERDSCGVGFVAHIRNSASHGIVRQGLEILYNLEHRGASGANPTTGDGAGMLARIPHRLLADACGFALPQAGEYGVAMLFLPRRQALRAQVEADLAAICREEDVPLLGWRDVPVDRAPLNDEIRGCEPVVRQLFLGIPEGTEPGDDFERRLFVLRRLFEKAADRRALSQDPAGFYIPSMSSRTIVYKGMFLANQLEPYYDDLRNEAFESPFALVHQRFSTNTFPEWSLAHPYRMLAHNGEINTLRGNINNMIARERSASSSRIGEALARVWPLVREGQSDSASLDNALELLRMAGYPLPHAMAMLIPEAWQGHHGMDPRLHAFYQYHAQLMEPWDGPALVAFTDGVHIGATLDRNGLRPARYIVTEDDLIVMASETGVASIPDIRIRLKWRLQPGKMLLVDLEKGAIVDNADLKEELASKRAYRQWVESCCLGLGDLPPQSAAEASAAGTDEGPDLLALSQAFGYTAEDLKFILRPMVEDGQEPVGSMGDDAPQAVLSSRMKPLYDYFRQEFAQVTNPAIDPIREQMVMSLVSYLGERGNALEPDHFSDAPLLVLEHPVLTPAELESLRAAGDATNGRIVVNEVDITCPTDFVGPDKIPGAIEHICRTAAKSVEHGCNILLLSDRYVDSGRAPIPALLAVSAIHHRLIEQGLRTRCGIVVDTGSAREVHHFAVLAGYGADAVCPYLAFRTIETLPLFKRRSMSVKDRFDSYRSAVGKGILKVMSKMGVSTYQSYCGAQIFEAVGLAREFVDRYFPRTISQIEGIGLDEVIAEAVHWHGIAFAEEKPLAYDGRLDDGGNYTVRTRGERHLWTAGTIGRLQHAVRANDAVSYREYAERINGQADSLATLRGMMRFADGIEAVPLEEVEPAASIVKRFSTGAMSLGSLSPEAHSNLAVAMNRIGGRSNTGEGGEDPARFIPLVNGDSARSSIKQVASGRFGVTAEYLVNSDMMQIKIAQGAKPGEGGQLPGHKVDRTIARLRHSVPGVGLISPPPHHDIYSIEDIAQLIHDLKSVNRHALVSVKLVSRFGVGTVAAGVAKAKSDHITIAGHDGGTGASPLSSIKHAGTPWELGLSETHQTLVLNDLRGRIILQVDGQIKTGRDVVIGALLGADEFGFATAPLVAQGCIMMRKCHLNTCPVGIATQNPELRRKFAGAPEHVVNYFFFVAEEVRTLMARLGFRTFNEMIGRVDRLEFDGDNPHWKAAKLDFSPVLRWPEMPPAVLRRHGQSQDHRLEEDLDVELVRQAQPAIDEGTPVVLRFPIRNLHRTVGARLSGELVRRYGHSGLPDDTIRVRFEGVAGQSFGAFLAKGITFDLKGETNDYTGKGLSGGVIVVRSPACPSRDGRDSIIVGNTVLYGAIAGECYFRGFAGERFAVRNSGAHAVVEGSGDHCCEYMTGGTVVLLGPCGRNFAAGMSGGVAYVLDADGAFADNCNQAMVDLVALESDPAPAQHLGRPDAETLTRLLQRHFDLTDSPAAKAVLDAPGDWLPRFVKVMPREYARALQQLSRAEEEMVA